jgi:hypothetical protein
VQVIGPDIMAAGLGLVVYSADALAHLEDGLDYSAEFEPGGTLHHLVRNQEVAFLGTGSPQLTYRLGVSCRGEPASVRAQIVFGMRVGPSGSVCARDGYDVMEWEAGASVVRLQVEPGYYALTASWIASDDPDVDMCILFEFAATTTVLEGDGWPYLPYSVGMGTKSS